LVDWELNFIIYFDFFHIVLSWFHEPGQWFDMLIWVDPDQLNMFLFQYYFKKNILSSIFINQTMFLPVVQVVFGPTKTIRIFQFVIFQFVSWNSRRKKTPCNWQRGKVIRSCRNKTGYGITGASSFSWQTPWTVINLVYPTI
jgi:hypothetical protein